MDRRGFIQLGAVVMAAGVSGGSGADLAPPSQMHPGDEAFAVTYRTPDEIGERLSRQYIWISAPQADTPGNLYAAFRKSIELHGNPRQVHIHIFAYTRYRLYINGHYVARGPARFQNNGPQYDTIEVAHLLHPGRNVVAVFVIRDAPTGRVMDHLPGLTVLLEGEVAGGAMFHVATDNSWRCAQEASYLPRPRCWGSIVENVDARLMTADWTQIDFDDETWKTATPVIPSTESQVTAETFFAPLRARSIPLLRERAVPRERVLLTSSAGHELPVTVELPFELQPNSSLDVNIGLVEQAYLVVTMEAAAGTKLSAQFHGPDSEDGTNTYITRDGSQTWMCSDTFGLVRVVLSAEQGSVRILDLGLVAVNYPFERVGSFECSDKELNSLWDLSVRSLEVLSEDSYVDCANRERVEWMDNTPPAYQLTRLALAGPSPDGRKVLADARLHRDMLRRTALTQQTDGLVKAHTCSDRWDIHAIMLDRACDWVDAVLHYYECSGDSEFAAEMFPFIQRLLDWFSAHRTERGLVQAAPHYEWVVWGNPMGYQKGEGTCLNAFVYRAFEAAAEIARHIGRKNDEAAMRLQAHQLKAAMNTHLWNAAAGSYFSGIFAPDVEPVPTTMNGPFHLRLDSQRRAEPTLWAAVFALDRGIVPPERKRSVLEYVLHNFEQLRTNDVMIFYYLGNLLFSQQEEKFAKQALDLLRTNFSDMASSPWHTAWENLHAGSRIHVYGAAPAVLLGTRVLGVHCNAPALSRRIVLRPQLGDLTFAKGTICTEHGLVDVHWKREGATMSFEFTIPMGADATLFLPCAHAEGDIKLNGASRNCASTDGWCSLDLPSGKYEGSIRVE